MPVAKNSYRKRPQTRFKFLVDGMLGTIATKLRILGFDTTYDKVSSDEGLLEHAKNSGRLLLTSDTELFLQARRIKQKSVLITSRNDLDRMVELFWKIGVTEIPIPKVSRCSVCNGRLRKTSQKSSLGKDIYTCTHCKKNYWRGTHWRKLDVFFSEANAKLEKHLKLQTQSSGWKQPT